MNVASWTHILYMCSHLELQVNLLFYTSVQHRQTEWVSHSWSCDQELQRPPHTWGGRWPHWRFLVRVSLVHWSLRFDSFVSTYNTMRNCSCTGDNWAFSRKQPSFIALDDLYFWVWWLPDFLDVSFALLHLLWVISQTWKVTILGRLLSGWMIYRFRLAIQFFGIITLLFEPVWLESMQQKENLLNFI